jgi:hypothetical protein
VKELDFLPEWYRNGRRRQSHMRKQYVALALTFLAMISFNVTATHRAGRAAAELTRGEHRRMEAEGVVYEFSRVTKELNTLRVKADLIDRIDAKVDVAAILGELSHLIGEAVVLRKVELAGEPCGRATEPGEAGRAVVRVARRSENSAKEAALGNIRFRIVLAGVAAQPTDVADLVCRLDQSSYFRQVSPSFSRGAKLPSTAETTPGGKPTGKAPETLDVTEFEIGCYLANYEEVGKP